MKNPGFYFGEMWWVVWAALFIGAPFLAVYLILLARRATRSLKQIERALWHMADQNVTRPADKGQAPPPGAGEFDITGRKLR
jgi:hypothetical protein